MTKLLSLCFTLTIIKEFVICLTVAGRMTIEGQEDEVRRRVVTRTWGGDEKDMRVLGRELTAAGALVK